MEEDNILVEDYEVSEEQPEVAIETTVEIIEVDEVETVYVDADEAFSALGEPNEQLRHQLLTGRDTSDQHPIIAITGLREELDDIESLKTVYSDKKQLADYYEWEDGNILNENRVGYFVSLCEDTRVIKICTDDEIFGVTIDNAAFVGGQDDVARDDKYGLVIYSGVVDVICELDVGVGNCVLPNSYGMAKKTTSGYGYKVVAINNKNDVKYATILLNLAASQMDTLSESLNTISERMDNAEINIITAINVANEAYNIANSSTAGEEALGKANEALGKADQALSNTENLQQQVQDSVTASVQAQALANSALTSAETIRTEAKEVADNALAEVNNLIKDLEPIYTWTDPETGNIGAEYLTTYMKDGLATKTEVFDVNTKTENNKTSIKKNAENFQTLVSSVDKYSVGEYSQAYGLTLEQAQSILTEGMIYIPIGSSHSEDYEEITQNFSSGYYYTWDGTKWIESGSNAVIFSAIMPAGTAYKYWYIDSDMAPEGYEPYALYLYDKNKKTWDKVNILSGNVNNRITSMIRQTANKIALDVSNTQGSVASHQQWLDDNSANVQDVVSWKSSVAKDVSNIATIKQTADDASASVGLVVAKKNGKKVINAASIVTAINDSGDSSIVLDADHIDIANWSVEGSSLYSKFGNEADGRYTILKSDGEVTFAAGVPWGNQPNSTSKAQLQIYHNGRVNLGYNGSGYNVVIEKNGDVSLTGKITATSLTLGSDVSISKGAQSSDHSTPYFNVSTNGLLTANNAIIYGNVCASTGYIGGENGWTIEGGRIRSIATDGGEFWLTTDPNVSSKWLKASIKENGANVDKFYVERNTGKLYAQGAEIDGKITAVEGTIGGWTLQNGYLRSYTNKTDSKDGAFYLSSGQYSGSSSNLSNYWIYIYDTAGNIPFCLTKSGEMTFNKSSAGGYNFDKNYTYRAIDASNAMSISVGTLSPTEEQKKLYDIDGDGVITASDARLILRKSVGKNDSPKRISVSVTREGFTVTDEVDKQGENPIFRAGRNGTYIRELQTAVATTEDTTSDINVKNNIELLTDDYDILFDNLIPRRFKYNHGTSDRFHTGFIAQEIVEALEKSNLTTQDFATVVHLDTPLENGAEWALRKEEMVALNTWQIQKLKARVAELEEKIKRLEV